MKADRILMIYIPVLAGILYGLLSAARNQNPYYPAPGDFAVGSDTRHLAWSWRPSPAWLPSYLLCAVPQNGFGISHTRSGYLFRSEGGRAAYFLASAAIGLAFGLCLSAVAAALQRVCGGRKGGPCARLMKETR